MIAKLNKNHNTRKSSNKKDLIRKKTFFLINKFYFLILRCTKARVYSINLTKIIKK